jgi:hypothetical protein
MSSPRPKDVQQRYVEEATRNDVRQYGQSAMGALYMTAWGHNQGQLFTTMAIHPRTPFDQIETTGREEAASMVEQFLDPSYDPSINVQMRFDLYGTQMPDGVAGNDDTGY